MKLNHRPARVAFLDFETQSERDLKQCSARQYAADPTTRALTCVVKVGSEVLRMGPYLQPRDLELLQRIAETHTLAAHNAAFDGDIWDHCLKLPEAEWFDTMPCARAAGLPGGLDDICKVLFGEGKDKNGKRLIDMLCIVKNGRVPALGPAHGLLLDYNERDVQLLERVYERVKGYGEPEVIAVDWTINQRGIPGNRGYMLKLKELYAEHVNKAREAFDEETGGVNPRSTKQVAEWIQGRGFNVEKINKIAYKSFQQNPEKYFVGDGDMDLEFEAVRDAMELRRDVARVGGSKVDAALAVLDADGRMREQHVYWGAHTGRWSARKLQVHNFYSQYVGVLPHEVELSLAGLERGAALASERTKKQVNVADVFGSLLRSMIQSEVGISAGDYAAVELRMTAYLADCERLLKLLSDPKASAYLDMGESIFNERLSKSDERYVFCKSLVLGSGYGMSGAKFARQCAMRDVDTSALDKLGISVADTVKQFRRTYPEIPALWSAYDAAVKFAVAGDPTEAGKCKFYMDGKDLHAELPSGRCIVYRNARMMDLVPAYCAIYNMPEIPVPTVVFDHPKGYRGFLYGSKVCENVSQGACRDFVADAILNCEQEGLNPILTVHDEVVNETANHERTLEIMSLPPSWAPDFPLLVEGYFSHAWCKHGQKEVKALNGRLL